MEFPTLHIVTLWNHVYFFLGIASRIDGRLIPFGLGDRCEHEYVMGSLERKYKITKLQNKHIN
eukprot:6229664-Amphidinium_carterae.1